MKEVSKITATAEVIAYSYTQRETNKSAENLTTSNCTYTTFCSLILTSTQKRISLSNTLCYKKTTNSFLTLCSECATRSAVATVEQWEEKEKNIRYLNFLCIAKIKTVVSFRAFRFCCFRTLNFMISYTAVWNFSARCLFSLDCINMYQ